MDAYYHFKEDLITHAISTLNAFEVEFVEEGKEREKEIQGLLKKIEQLENERITLKSQNQEWASKYEALNARLLPQLLPSEREVKGQDLQDQPTLGDFARLLEENGLLRRKLRIAQDERKFRERYGLEKRAACLSGHRNDQLKSSDQHLPSRPGYEDADRELPSVDLKGGEGRSKEIYQNRHSHADSERGHPKVGSEHISSRVDKDLHDLLPSFGSTKPVDEAISAGISGGSPAQVSDPCKERQSKSPRTPCRSTSLEEPSASDDETSSETQFSISRKEFAELATQKSADEDSDNPVVTAERCLKRKRGSRNDVGLRPPRASRSGEAQSPGSRKVKIELESSSQCGDLHLLSTNRVNETMDLDEVGSRMKTPKKPRQSLHNTTSPEYEQLGFEQEGVEEMLDDNRDREVLYERSQSEPVARTVTRFAGVSSEHRPLNTRQVLALQPKDTNPLLRKVQQKGHRITTTPHSTRRLKRDQRSAAVGIIAEDGDESHMRQRAPSRGSGRGDHSNTESQADRPDGRPSSSNQRLDRALNELPAQKPVLTPKVPAGSNKNLAMTNKSTSYPNQKRQLKLPGPTTSIASRTCVLQDTSQHVLSTNHGQQPRSTARKTFRSPPYENVYNRRRSEHLRSRPPESLMLGDFVMNPNARMNYTFNEPVRSRDQRKCLPTCTKPDCCGTKFLKLAHIGGVAPFKPGLWSSSPPNEEEADEALLLEHLNNDHAQLRSMSKTDKTNMLLQIKAQQMGNAIGRHKITGFERAKTPPGFWRADMPSTQEVEEDREEARNLERQKVQERWHEAMAEDGKGLWKFRDE